MLSLVISIALAQTCPTRASWPTEEWPRNPVNTTAKAAEIKALEDYAFTLVGKDSERLGYRTEGLVIIKNGAIIYERYGRGFDETKRHLSWSVAKSFSSALVGIAVKQGALRLEDSICEHLSEYQGTPQCAITVKDAITFGTALGWQEEYEDQSYQVSSYSRCCSAPATATSSSTSSRTSWSQSPASAGATPPVTPSSPPRWPSAR
jgi:CubicO group peptidase (beta-lactamase class C family)